MFFLLSYLVVSTHLNLIFFHHRQLLNLLEVIMVNAESDSGMTKGGASPEQPSGSEGTSNDAHMNVDPAGGSDGGGSKPTKTEAHSSSSRPVNIESNTRSILLGLPQRELRLLCSLLAREGYE